MDYFKNVQSLSELKAQYRQLVLANHPDNGKPAALQRCGNKK